VLTCYCGLFLLKHRHSDTRDRIIGKQRETVVVKAGPSVRLPLRISISDFCLKSIACA
jgi:hypothetical protein